jgi:hypothetical protein
MRIDADLRQGADAVFSVGLHLENRKLETKHLVKLETVRAVWIGSVFQCYQHSGQHILYGLNLLAYCPIARIF